MIPRMLLVLRKSWTLKLIASLGEDFPMTDLGEQIAHCPRRHADGAA